MDTFIGKTVLIIGAHPWAGEIGVVKEIRDTSMCVKGYVVDLKNGTTCFVFNANNFQILKI